MSKLKASTDPLVFLPNTNKVYIKENKVKLYMYLRIRRSFSRFGQLTKSF